MTSKEALRLAARIYSGKPVTTKVLRTYYGMSPASAKRAMRMLADCLPVDVEVGERRTQTLRLHREMAARSIGPRPSTWMQY